MVVVFKQVHFIPGSKFRGTTFIWECRFVLIVLYYRTISDKT